jgi:hypothetical protein
LKEVLFRLYQKDLIVDNKRKVRHPDGNRYLEAIQSTIKRLFLISSLSLSCFQVIINPPIDQSSLELGI